MYGDFKKASFHQVVTFLYGCAATFAGVFIIAWSSQTDNDDEYEASENSTPVEENPEEVASLRAEQVASNLSLGSLGRRRRATLILPAGMDDSALHHRQGAVSVMGLSPAQVGISTTMLDCESYSFPREAPSPGTHTA